MPQRTVREPHIIATAITLDDRGTGRPFLLLHGGAGPSSVLPFAQVLATTGPAHVITPTIPGFDGTPRPAGLDSIADLARTWLGLLGEHDLHDVTVLGSSIGGWTAAEMLTDPRSRERISSAVLLDPVGILVPEHPIRNVAGMPLGQLADPATPTRTATASTQPHYPPIGALTSPATQRRSRTTRASPTCTIRRCGPDSPR